MSIDVLAVGAHADDIELGAGGILARLSKQGHKVALLDLTQAALSTRGDIVTREREAAEAARILGATERHNLRLTEGEILTNSMAIPKFVTLLRNLRPKLILAPWFEDRHPDHGDASNLTQRAWFWAGVAKFGDDQPPHRAKRVAYYSCHREGAVSLVVDITDTFEIKLEAIRAYSSQFTLPRGETPNTFISRPDFLDRIVTRARYYGMQIGTTYGEPLYLRETNRVDDLMAWCDKQGDVG